MSHTPSHYQSAVYAHITDGTGNAVVDAVAGSGKSTTIVEALKLIPLTLRVLFLAFNKAIVEELKLKIGTMSNVEICTLHSLGFSAIRNTFRNVKVDSNKYFTFISDGIKFGMFRPTIELVEEENINYKSNIVKLVDLARAYLCTDENMLYSIAEKYCINVLDNECSIAMTVLNWGKNNVAVIDFTDMIYFPNVKNLTMPQFDFVFIDECQDLNTAQREMFLKTLKSTGRFVAVGDPRQAIYGFAGADVESFNLLKSLPNTVNLPLSVCYRSASSIINLAKEIVPQIEARENAPDGVVSHEAKVADIQDGDMVLCRVTAPLVALCMQYIGKGIKAYVKGRDIGTNLINMIKATKRVQMSDVMLKLSKDLEKIATKIVNRSHCTLSEAKNNSVYTNMQDKINAINVIAKDLKTSTAVMNRIEAIFKDNDNSGICLSTVHKAKGLESNNVFIIRPDKFYLKHAMRVEWMAEQERNLVYVAYTRAKHFLGFVTDFQADTDEY
jgi:superfamily I DNA/RNA helicase